MSVTAPHLVPTALTEQTLEVAARSETGCRAHNEDALLADEPLFAVADGVGGGQAGEVAAQMALAVLRRRARGVEGDLAAGARAASAAVRAASSADPALAGMATTLTALRIDSGRAEVVHVGDSRAYRLRDGALELLTDDHTFTAELERAGSLSHDEARVHPLRSTLMRAVGGTGDPDHVEVDALPGDVFLIATDGLTGSLEDDQLATLLGMSGPVAAVSAGLVAAALRAGSRDNVTAVVVRVS